MEAFPLARSTQLISRALRRRCPNCDSPDIFTSWFTQPDRCPGCGLPFEREEGYFLGGMTINLVVAESIPIVGLALIWLLVKPTPPLLLLEAGVIFGAVVLPLLFFPFSRTLWLALDLYFRPLDASEVIESPVDLIDHASGCLSSDAHFD